MINSLLNRCHNITLTVITMILRIRDKQIQMPPSLPMSAEHIILQYIVVVLFIGLYSSCFNRTVDNSVYNLT